MERLYDFLAGTATGLLSGFGVGGGTLLLVYMTAVRGLEQHLAQGINLLYFLPAASAALPSHQKNRYLDRRIILPAVCAGVCCTALAAWISSGLQLGPLRKCFGLFLLLTGLSELFHKKSR